MLMDGGGFGTITGNTFQIKQEAVTPGAVGGLTAAEIEQLFSYLPEPSLVSESGRAHTAASEVLADIADSLVKHVQVLNEAWSGTAAQAAVTGFQQLHQTAIGLAQASAKTGAVLSWLGETILPFYKNYKAPALSVIGHIEAAVGHNPSDIAAQQVLERLNNRLAQANANLPPSVSKNLPAALGAVPAAWSAAPAPAAPERRRGRGRPGPRGRRRRRRAGQRGSKRPGRRPTVGSLGTAPHGSPGAPASSPAPPGAAVPRDRPPPAARAAAALPARSLPAGPAGGGIPCSPARPAPAAPAGPCPAGRRRAARAWRARAPAVTA